MMPRAVLGFTLLLLLGCSSSTPTTFMEGEHLGSHSARPPEPRTTHPVTPPTSGEKPKPPPTAAPMNPAVTRTKEAGLIRGRVLAKGGKGSADVAVWVTAPRLQSPEPTEAVRLVQAQGGYSPRVLFARVGQHLELRTTEDRADFQASGAATFSDSLKKGQVRSHRLSTPGTIDVRSQLHPDLAAAHVHVVSHDWYAVSNADGTFRLPPLPPGEYSLTLLHDGGESQEGKQQLQQVQVKLEKGEGAAIEWTLPEK